MLAPGLYRAAEAITLGDTMSGHRICVVCETSINSKRSLGIYIICSTIY
jgi:hypothetical protein